MLEDKIRNLTRKINGQYPRPWMTNLTDPMNAQVFIVGANQATAYTDDHVQSHGRHLDILFNRNGYNCYGFYEAVRGEKPSKTRRNIEKFTEILNESGVSKILETNLICYSTTSYAGLTTSKHPGGKEVGLTIFKTLIQCIHPKILILHGANVQNEFRKVFNPEAPNFPMLNRKPVPRNTPIEKEIEIGESRSVVFPIPSLAPPQFNIWSSWAEEYLTKVGTRVKDILSQ